MGDECEDRAGGDAGVLMVEGEECGRRDGGRAREPDCGRNVNASGAVSGKTWGGAVVVVGRNRTRGVTSVERGCYDACKAK